jgi:hypothetical protein
VHRLGPVLFVAAALLWLGSAQAAAVAILRPERTSPELTEALFRLQGELLALGIEVEVSRRIGHGEDDGDTRAAFERRAAERKLDAIIDVLADESPPAADVWTFPRAPATSEVSRVVFEPGARSATETFAIRAIEVLRSRLLEIDLLARERAGAPPLTPARPPPPRERAAPRSRADAPTPRLGLEGGAVVLTSLDGVGPALMPLVRVDAAVHPRLVAQATFSGLGTRPVIERGAESARVALSYGLLGLCYCSPFETGLGPVVGLSAGALRTSLSGHADAPERGHAVARWSFLVDAALGARLGLPGRYYLTLASHVQLAQPYVAVHFVDERVASSGRPNVLVTLTVGGWL